MIRKIYEVTAKIVDANGVYNTLSGYPKTFDSKNYGNDVDKTLQRAEGELSETFGAMCKRDDRQLQMVILMSVDGFVVDKKCIGYVHDLPDPEPEIEPAM